MYIKCSCKDIDIIMYIDTCVLLYVCVALHGKSEDSELPLHLGLLWFGF